MIDRVIANGDRIIIVLMFLTLGMIILSWVMQDIETRKNMKVVNGNA